MSLDGVSVTEQYFKAALRRPSINKLLPCMKCSNWEIFLRAQNWLMLSSAIQIARNNDVKCHNEQQHQRSHQLEQQMMIMTYFSSLCKVRLRGTSYAVELTHRHRYTHKGLHEQNGEQANSRWWNETELRRKSDTTREKHRLGSVHLL